jgi:subtilisin family serine protease
MKDFPRELVHGSGAVMNQDPSRLLLAFRQEMEQPNVTKLIQAFGLVLEDSADSPTKEPRGFPEIVNHTAQRFWTRTLDRSALTEEQYQRLRKNLSEQLEWVGPVYQFSGTQGRANLLCPLPNVLLIKPASSDEAARKKFDALMKRHGLKEVGDKSDSLGGYRYFELSKSTSYQLQPQLSKERQLIAQVHFENMPMVIPIATVPNDPFVAQQWAMAQIQAGGPGTTGWDLSTGTGVTVAVLDTGVDLTHPDLSIPNQGIRLDTMMPTGAPQGPASIIGHGTCCAGLVAGRFNNAQGVAGVAGGADILPIAFVNWTDAEVAAGINWGAANGASVISMSFGQYAPGDGFGPTGWNFAIIDPAITNAVDVVGVVLVAATGNENTGNINRYPARNPRVIAVGGSDQSDNRKSPASPDGECWGANFGPGVSVVAPCVLNPTTDIQGNPGFNMNGGPATIACVNYPSTGDAAGDYFLQFDGTSSATPIVAGLAAAIRGAYPALTNLEVRELIDRTADKVGGAYADAAGFPNGTRNNEMGYGRVNMFRALDEGDVLIRDYPADSGIEPSSPPGGDFWDFSDVVVRIFDDNVFNPGDPTQSSNVERGQTNFIYVQVTNRGPQEARNVTVSTRITPYVGLQFVYPADWTAVDATHVSPTPISAAFPSIAAGTSVIAKFSVSAADVEVLWGWISTMPWHPCLLASVSADNDYAWATASTGASPQVKRNNLAQRNLSLINVLATASVTFPLIAGNLHNAERQMDVVVNRSRFPRATSVLLALEDDGAAFPRVPFERAPAREDVDGDGMIFLERTRVEMKLACCRSVLTLQPGSRFDCAATLVPGKLSVTGGEVIIRNGKRFVDIRENIAVIRMEKVPNQIYPLSLHAQIPPDAVAGALYWLSVSQRDTREQTVGGASVVYKVK